MQLSVSKATPLREKDYRCNDFRAGDYRVLSSDPDDNRATSIGRDARCPEVRALAASAKARKARRQLMNSTTDIPDPNTQLALRRNFLATERTLMAWIRTSISMIGFGFTLAKLFQSLAESNVLIRGPAGNVWTAVGVGLVLVSLGTAALVVAVFDHYRELKQLRAAGLPARFSLTTAVASVLAILGMMALLSLLVYR
jgi:putative membrane protein